MRFSIISQVELNNGIKIPYLGFGTYKLNPDSEAKEAVSYALEAGYRHIDTAAAYGNEKGVGEAIRESGIPREEIFITTKLANDDQGYNTALKAFDQSLKSLDTDYIDLYIIHWPVSDKRSESWKALTKIAENDTCRAIGVSNYTIRHLKELFSESDIVPAVNQVEFNPFIYQKDLLDYCNSKGIKIVAYTPLARTEKFDNPVVKELSGKYSKTPAQVLLRWSLQHELIVIPKSSKKSRIYENADLFDFEINQEDMEKMNNLNQNYRMSMDPEEMK